MKLPRRCSVLAVLAAVTLSAPARALPSGFGEAAFDGIVFVKVPAGSFLRGTGEAQSKALEAAGLWTRLDSAEQPARRIRITRAFFLSKFEITQAQWDQVMGGGAEAKGKKPGSKQHAPSSSFKGPELPVETVSWNDAREFALKLTEKSGGAARYRLPTEAEWEYACRAGSEDAFGMGADKLPITGKTLPEYAWFSANADNRTHPVGAKKPNAWGLCDMLGNVWEWCQDSYSIAFYATGPDTDPVCSDPDATERVFRGGCWFLDARSQRAAVRGGNLPDFKSPYVGFRIVREI